MLTLMCRIAFHYSASCMSSPYAEGKSMRGMCPYADAEQVCGDELDTDREDHSSCCTPLPGRPYWKPHRVYCRYQGEFHESTWARTLLKWRQARPGLA